MLRFAKLAAAAASADICTACPQGLPLLSVLYLKGNPAVSAMRGYRKTLIAALPGLNYLDDRPVLKMERLCAEAWQAPRAMPWNESLSLTLRKVLPYLA